MLLHHLLDIPTHYLEFSCVKFYPYTSRVDKRIFKVSCDTPELRESYRSLQHSLIERFRLAGVDAYEDNKTVFEVIIQNQKVFFGFYDWRISIGFGVISL